ncbi:MAG: thioredoxin fold domain-containing protein [Pseudomonadota bacterium]|nr:thioredoxin fold domain-containing protein [Pseudomonadota bacterium]
MKRGSSVAVPAFLAVLLFPVGSDLAHAAAPGQIYSFDDRPTDYDGGHPDWFKQSFLDLDEDLDEALENGKSGLIVYFGQAHCAYCKAIMAKPLSRPDLVEYLVRHFDLVGLSIHDVRELTSPDGETLTVKEYSIREEAQFTPTLTFFGRDRRKALTLRGFYPAYEIRAALEYVADGHYQTMTFRDYLARANPPPLFDDEKLISDSLFMGPPYALDRRHFAASQPLAVIFEQPECHACDVLHSEPLQDPVVRQRLERFNVVQLNVRDRLTPVLTPDGRRVTPAQWAADLKLFYTPTLIFFDLDGKEVFRVDSIVQFFRLAGVLRYVADRAYREHPVFQHWKYAINREELQAFPGKPGIEETRTDMISWPD